LIRIALDVAIFERPGLRMLTIWANFGTVRRMGTSLCIAQRKRKPNIKHQSQAHDFRAGLEVTEWAAFCHPTRLRNHPARLKPVFSDKTGWIVVVAW